MKQKGQIISLDFLFSVAIMVLALGITLQFIEVNSYAAAQQKNFNVLKAVGSSASERLISMPDSSLGRGTMCGVIDNFGDGLGDTVFSLPSCIDKQKIGSHDYDTLAHVLGIDTAEFEYHVVSYDEGGIEIGTGPVDASDIYSESRKVIFYDGPVGKDVIDNCMGYNLDYLKNGLDKACSLEEKHILLEVWRP